MTQELEMLIYHFVGAVLLCGMFLGMRRLNRLFEPPRGVFTGIGFILLSVGIFAIPLSYFWVMEPVLTQTVRLERVSGRTLHLTVYRTGEKVEYSEPKTMKAGKELDLSTLKRGTCYEADTVGREIPNFAPTEVIRVKEVACPRLGDVCHRHAGESRVCTSKCED